MRTVISDPPPEDFEAFLEKRRAWGGNRRDEVWGGEYRMMPVPGYAHRLIDNQLALLLEPLARRAGLISGGELNLGHQGDFRIPDRGLWRPEDGGDWQETVAIAIAIVSPGDETYAKPPFYAAHDVDELVIIEPRERAVQWLALEAGEYRPVARSRLIDLGADELTAQLDWPEIRD